MLLLRLVDGATDCPAGCEIPDRGCPATAVTNQDTGRSATDGDATRRGTYCLIEAAQRYQIDMLLPCAMSNHYHAVIFDRSGRYPGFVEHFHKMFARSQNALRGRWENLWASEQVCVVMLVDRAAVIDKLVYTAVNPVQSHLVEAQCAADRRRTGRRVCGRRAVLDQSWRDQPGTREPRRNLRPRVAAPNKWARIEALLRNRAFVREYVAARQQWRDGAQVVFPMGTYWLRRFAYVPVPVVQT